MLRGPAIGRIHHFVAGSRPACWTPIEGPVESRRRLQISLKPESNPWSAQRTVRGQLVKELQTVSVTSRGGGILAGILLATAIGGAPDRSACAQTKSKTQSTPTTQTAPKPTVEKAGRRLEALKKSTTLKADVKQRMESYYTQAAKTLKSAAGFDAKLQRLNALEQSAAELSREAHLELKKPLADPQDGIAIRDLRKLEGRLKQAQAEKDAADKDAREWEAQQAARANRKTAVPQRLIDTKRELAKAQSDSKGAPPSSEPVEAVPALRFLQRSQIVALESEIALLAAELPAYKATDALVDLKLRAAQHRKGRAEKQAAFWRNSVEKHRGFEARRQVVESQTMVDNFRKAGMHRVVVELAAENLQLARLRTGPDGTVEKLHDVVLALEKAEQLLKKLAAERKELDEKLKIEGIEGEIGPLLVVQRRELPSVGRYSRRIASRNRDLSRVRLSYIDAQQRSGEAVDLDASVEAILEQTTGSGEESDRKRIDRAARNILHQRKAIYELLLGDYRTLLEQLAELTARERLLIETTQAVRELIDRHILWVRTTAPFGATHFKDLEHALNTTFDPDLWGQAGTALWRSLLERPILTTLMLLLFAFARYKYPAMKQRLEEIGEESGRGFLKPFSLTVNAFLLTALLSAVWPIMIAYAGWNLRTYSDSARFADISGTALFVVAISLFTFDFLRRMFRPSGLAESHFRWKDARLRILRRHLRWFTAAVLPGVFLYVLIAEYGDDRSIASLGRLTLIILLLMVAGFLAVVLRDPRVKLPFCEVLGLKHSAAAKQASFWQIAVYLGVVLFPVVLAALAAAGFLYTATLLTWKLLCSAWLAVCLVTLHAMAVRWLYYARGKLALEQSQTAKAATDTEDAKPTVGPSAEQSKNKTTPIEETQPSPTAKRPARSQSADLAAVNAQTRRLLQIVVGCTVAVGLWSIWRDVVPALKFLDYPLWTHQAVTTRLVEGADGATIPEPMTVVKEFTLGNLLLAVVIVAVVFIAATNLPGLLEVGLLQRLPLDSGARYAATALTRYGIYAVGIVLAFNLMGIGWSKVQWLVAALSVGLGFGLQEIVANFVSGIILLFERPLRVGDVVTIGEVSGVVTRIKIRATTVRNWDRKEYIVPNKELITGKLMNWTLSDSINRIVINVGVGYDSDPREVRRVLMSVVDDQPDILKVPAPLVTLEGFGDSSLNFVIRCYLAELGPRMETTHDLHAEIHRRLEAAGIVIPFPQHDLHIRDDASHESGATPVREGDVASESSVEKTPFATAAQKNGGKE